MKQTIDKAIRDVMNDFSKQNRVFFNEANFESEFAIELHKRLPSSDYNVILEHSPNFNGYRVDMLIEDMSNKEKTEKAVVEFKYVVKAQQVSILPGLYVNLKDQGAYDTRRYKIWMDIAKIEELKSHSKCDYGYFILLTNVGKKLIGPVPSKNIDAEFDISQGTVHPNKKHLPADLWWNKDSTKFETGKTANRYPKHVYINNAYTFDYITYGTDIGYLEQSVRNRRKAV